MREDCATIEQWWNADWQGKPGETQREQCSSTKYLLHSHLGLKERLRREEPA
jgi:hypothetical protein